MWAVRAFGAIACAISVASCGADDGPGPLTVRGKDIFFEPAALSLTPGPQSVRFVNVGALPHNLVFEPESGLVAGDAEIFLDAGESETYELDLAPGTYTFFCSVAGHREAGMEGTITVG